MTLYEDWMTNESMQLSPLASKMSASSTLGDVVCASVSKVAGIAAASTGAIGVVGIVAEKVKGACYLRGLFFTSI